MNKYPPNTTPVFLTPEQAALFVLFMQHYDSIGFMIGSGVFDMKQGNVVLSFDQKGRLKTIKRELYTYMPPEVAWRIKKTILKVWKILATKLYMRR